MKLVWMRWITIKEFDRWQCRTSRDGRARAVKRRRELARRWDRIQRANTIAIFPELAGRP